MDKIGIQIWAATGIVKLLKRKHKEFLQILYDGKKTVDNCNSKVYNGERLSKEYSVCIETVEYMINMTRKEQKEYLETLVERKNNEKLSNIRSYSC